MHLTAFHSHITYTLTWSVSELEQCHIHNSGHDRPTRGDAPSLCVQTAWWGVPPPIHLCVRQSLQCATRCIFRYPSLCSQQLSRRVRRPLSVSPTPTTSFRGAPLTPPPVSPSAASTHSAGSARSSRQAYAPSSTTTTAIVARSLREATAAATAAAAAGQPLPPGAFVQRAPLALLRPGGATFAPGKRDKKTKSKVPLIRSVGGSRYARE